MRLWQNRAGPVAIAFLFLACDASTPVAVGGPASGVGGSSGFAGAGGGTAFGGFSGGGAVGGISGGGAVGGASSLPVDPFHSGAPTSALNEYSPAACGSGTFGVGARCFQYFVCERPCENDSECPDGGSGSPDVACVSEGFPTPVCVLRCGDGAVCPDGMQCVVTGHDALGSACLWATPRDDWGCPGRCAQRDEPCTSEVGAGLRTLPPPPQNPCCQGMVCAPSGRCEAGSCLQPSWPCGPERPDCCNGVCENGFCPE